MNNFLLLEGEGGGKLYINPAYITMVRYDEENVQTKIYINGEQKPVTISGDLTGEISEEMNKMWLKGALAH